MQTCLHRIKSCHSLRLCSCSCRADNISTTCRAHRVDRHGRDWIHRCYRARLKRQPASGMSSLEDLHLSGALTQSKGDCWTSTGLWPRTMTVAASCTRYTPLPTEQQKRRIRLATEELEATHAGRELLNSFRELNVKVTSWSRDSNSAQILWVLFEHRQPFHQLPWSTPALLHPGDLHTFSSARERKSGCCKMRALDCRPNMEDKLKGWTSGLRRAKAAAKGEGARVNKKSWAPASAFTGGSPPHVEEALESPGFRALQTESVIAYDPSAFPLHQAVLDMVAGVEPRIRETGLSQMHFAMDSKWTRSKSFKPHRRKFNGVLYNSEHGASLRREFQKFICDYLAPHVREHTSCRRIYFQSTPCLRIQPPSNNRGMAKPII